MEIEGQNNFMRFTNDWKLYQEQIIISDKKSCK